MRGQRGRSSKIGQCGRPRKHPGGWEYTFVLQRPLIQKLMKEEGSSVNDDAVAQHLLSVHERLESDDR